MFVYISGGVCEFHAAFPIMLRYTRYRVGNDTVLTRSKISVNALDVRGSTIGSGMSYDTQTKWVQSISTSIEFEPESRCMHCHVVINESQRHEDPVNGSVFTVNLNIGIQ